MLASIIIRTLNEGRYLDTLLCAIESQTLNHLQFEVIVVDSGSDDNTVSIALSHGCTIINITRQEFSFGRALNLGCKAANGEFLVIISGHCIPADNKWLQSICEPLIQEKASYSYGRQLGGEGSFYSECQIFDKYYPQKSKIPQEGFFCNNANSAITKATWVTYGFNEDLTGLEDMELAQRLVNDGSYVAYVAEAAVYHYHEESWGQIKRRFEREAIALQKIMPQVHIYRYDFFRYVVTSVFLDFKSAKKDGQLFSRFLEIIKYRLFQYWGSFVGNHDHRKLSHDQKEAYFYPQVSRRTNESENCRSSTNESK